MGQKDYSRPAKVQLTKEEKLDPYSSVLGNPTETQKPIDWIARWDDLNRAIEYLTLNGTHEDANGNIPNYAPQLQTLMNIRDQIRNSIKPLVDTDVEGYNGNWDPAFDPLVDSLVKESKQGENFLDGLQFALDVAGIVPVFGEAADGLNALVSLFRGNYVDAGLSAAAMMPLAGWAATIGKLAKKTIKGADAIAPVAKYADEFSEAGEAVTKELEDQIDQDWYHPTEPDILGGAPKAAEGAGESKKIPWDSWQNYEKVTANGQQYAKVGDRLYSEHAVDRMQPSGKRFTVGDAIVQAGGVSGRSVAPQFVEDVISSVEPVFQPATGNYMYTSGTVRIVTNEYGYVVTIITVGR